MLYYMIYFDLGITGSSFDDCMHPTIGKTRFESHLLRDKCDQMAILPFTAVKFAQHHQQQLAKVGS